MSLKLAWALRSCLNRDEECKVEDEGDAVGLILGHWVDTALDREGAFAGCRAGKEMM